MRTRNAVRPKKPMTVSELARELRRAFKAQWANGWHARGRHDDRPLEHPTPGYGPEPETDEVAP